jgi:hypothetical protein
VNPRRRTYAAELAGRLERGKHENSGVGADRGGHSVHCHRSMVDALLVRRNPFPIPDRGSRIFSATSPEAKHVIVELLAQHGVDERFQANSSGLHRSIMWDGTIINSSPGSYAEARSPSASIGLFPAIRRLVHERRPGSCNLVVTGLGWCSMRSLRSPSCSS